MSVDDLVATALLGTERRASDTTGWPAPLGDVAGAVAGDPAAVLLGRAALATVWARAGARPGAPVDREPAPAERLRAAAPAAASRLHALLEDGAHGLLDEWLAVAARRGLLAPPAALPALLDRGARSVAVRPHVRAVAGERGPWLARQRPEWAWLPRLADGLPDPDAGPATDLSDETWQLGDPATRLRWAGSGPRGRPGARPRGAPGGLEGRARSGPRRPRRRARHRAFPRRRAVPRGGARRAAQGRPAVRRGAAGRAARLGAAGPRRGPRPGGRPDRAAPAAQPARRGPP